jgi:pimeloyl-ACP methyl ester carboxylesterase
MTIQRLTALMMSLALLLPLGACTNKQDPTAANQTDPQWVSPRSEPHNKIAVVFLHGLFGDTLGTWTNKQGGTFFSYLKNNPSVGPKVDIFAFGFTSNMVKSGSLNVNEAANILHEHLKFHGVLEYPTIVFVAHSMGGLVALRYVIGHRAIIEQMPLLVLYASPQEGAQIAAIADHVAKNPALRDMFPADTNTFLQQLNDDWKGLGARPRVVCAYEKAETWGTMIVPWASATRYCDEAAAPIGGADHLTIVKPDRANHESVIVLVNAFEQNVTGKQLQAKLETPDFAPEDGKLVYLLKGPTSVRSARLVNAGGGKLSYTLAQVDPDLHLWPIDTPKDIPPRKTEDLHIGLGWGADKTEYTFMLKSDVTEDKVVVVKVPDIAAYRSIQAKLAASATSEVSRFLSSKEIASELASLPENDASVPARIVEVTRKAIARSNPDLPAYAHLILAADFLAASNWPDLAVVALREAERQSPAVANAPATQRLAGIVRAQSGTEKIFANAPTPKLDLAGVPKSDLLLRLVAAKQMDAPDSLAEQMQKIPALKAYGLTLEGDIHSARGETRKAQESYISASKVKSSPLLQDRLEDLKGWEEPGGARAAILNTPYRPDMNGFKARVLTEDYRPNLKNINPKAMEAGKK